MTIDKLELRIQELKLKMEEALATAQALHGAIQDCEYWKETLREDTDGERTALSTDGS